MKIICTLVCSFLFCITSIFAQAPINDDCINAIDLVLGINACSNPVNGTTENATQSMQAAPSCDYLAGGYDDDVWYKFTAAQSGLAKFEFTNMTGGTNAILSVAAYSGSDCNNLTEINCTQYAGYFNILHVTQGTTYYLRLYSSLNDPLEYKSFTLCAYMINNDECTTAQQLLPGNITTIGYNSVQGTTYGATESITTPLPTCPGNNDDVWYKITAAATGNMHVRLYSGANLSYQVYSGDCNGLTALDCIQATAFQYSYYNVSAVSGNDYYIRIFTTDPSPTFFADFSIEAYSLTPGPVNDECSNATDLILGTNVCDNQTNGYTIGATESNNLPAPSCDATGTDDDVWYKFTSAVSGSVRVELKNYYYTLNNNTGITVQVYEGSCNGMVAVSCHSFSGYTYSYAESFGLEINAIASTEYYLRVFTPENSPVQFSNFSICAFTLPPPPSNDECTGAIPLQVASSTQCQNPVAGTTVSSAGSSVAGCYGVNVDDDVWYSFVASSTQHRVTVTPAATNGIQDYIALQVFSGTCSSLTEMYCATSTGAPAPAQQLMAGLTIGETYFIRVYSLYDNYTSRGDFEICITTPNDECETAALLTVNQGKDCTAFSTGSTLDATLSSPNACGANFDDDVWYKFVATSVSHLLTVTPATIGGIDNIVLQVFGGDCQNLNSMLCIDNSSGSSPESATVGSLLPGETYYVRVYSYDYYTGRGDFTICVSTLNDECETAESLVVNPGKVCTDVTNGSTTGASQSSMWSYCSGSYDDDVWYKFIATASTHKITVTPASANGIIDVEFETFTGDCNALSPFTCTNNTTGSDAEEGFLTGLAVGNMYYIRVFSHDYNSGNGDFSICVTSYLNAACTTPETLFVNPDANCTTTSTGTSVVTGGFTPAGCTGDADDDVWYAFYAANSNYKITVTPAMVNGIDNAVIELFEGYCGYGSLFCADVTTGSSTEELIATGLNPNQWYIVRVYSYGSNTGAGDFDICVSTITTAPTNDECIAAFPLTVSASPLCVNPVQGTTVFATQSIPGDGCYPGSSPDDDVWYSFVALGTSHRVTVEPINVTTGISNPVFQLFSGDCNNLVSLDCSNTPQAYNPVSKTVNTIPGAIYYLRVFSLNSGTGQGDFNICVTSPSPLNDDCLGAINVPVNNDNNCTITTTGNTNGATSSGIYGNCVYGPADDDVWFKFTAAASAHTIIVTPSASGGINDLVMELYHGNCSVYMSGNGCANNTSGTAAELLVAEGLTAGVVYYLRIYSATNYSGGNGEFSVCIKNTVTNDDCSGAISIPVNDDATCSNVYHGTSVGSSQSGIAICNSNSIQDVWYSFVASSTAYSISVTAELAGGIVYPGWQLFSGDCNNLVSLGCANEVSTFENLVIGNTYYLQIYPQPTNGSQHGAFIICVQSINLSLPNDICAGAINLPINNDVSCVTAVTGTTTGAGVSVTTGLKDVWYSFTATESAHKIQVSPVADSLKNIAFQVYSGTCNSLTSIANVDNFPDPGFSSRDSAKAEIQSLENLVVGNTYYVRVFSTGVLRNAQIVNPAGSFNICVALSANDVCSFAREIPVNADVNCTITTIDSTNHSTFSYGSQYCNAISNLAKDSWFKFIALDTSEIVLVSRISGFAPVYWEMFSGSCENLTSIRCTEDRQVMGGLTIGETYYLRVFTQSSNGDAAKFSICISETAVNNECWAAINVPVNTNTGCSLSVMGSTIGSTVSPQYSCGNFYTAYYGTNGTTYTPNFSNDVWYKFTATSVQHRVTVTGITTGLDILFSVYSGTDCSSLSPIVCVDDYRFNTNSTDEEAVALDDLIIGNTYYVRVYRSYNGMEGEFNICIGNVEPLNDLCSNAILLPVNSGPACTLSTTGSNLGATRSYNTGTFPQYSYCLSDGNADMWYKFVASSANHLVSIAPATIDGIDDVMFMVYEGSCGALTYMNYVDQTSGNKSEVALLNNLVPGNTYYLRIANGNGQRSGRGAYTICITAPLENDDCTDAVTLAVNGDNSCTLQTTGTTTGATPTNGQQDVWYKFVATATEHRITTTSTEINTTITLFKGICNTLSQIREEIDYNAAGWGTEFQAYDSLVIGNTYYIRVRATQQEYPNCAKYANFNSTGTFTICVSAPAQANDLIDQAVNVPVNNSTICTTEVSGDNSGSSFSNNYSDCYNPTNYTYLYFLSDVWYKFTASATSHIITVTPALTGGIKNVAFSVVERVVPINNYDDGLRQRGCIKQNGLNYWNPESQSFNGLVPGREYFIRIMSSINTTEQGTFTVCVTTPQLPVDNNKIITFAGGGTGEGLSVENSKLYSPTDVAVDNKGNVYIADDGRIKKINKADGVVSIVAGTGVTGFSGDGGLATDAQIASKVKIAVDNDGNIFIGDYEEVYNNSSSYTAQYGRVRRISNSTGIINTIVALPVVFDHIDIFNNLPIYVSRQVTGITTDAIGNVYFIVNRPLGLNEQHPGWRYYDVYKQTPSGVFTQIVNGNEYGYGLTIDAAGNLFYVEIPEGDNRKIRKIEAVTNTKSTVAGLFNFGYTGDGGPATMAQLKACDVKVDATGNLYIAEGNGYWNGHSYGNYSIRKINTSGVITTIAGTGVNSYSGDNGPATQAAMHSPISIALDSAGNIYIADVNENESPLTATNRIRKILVNCNGGIAMSSMGNTSYLTGTKTIYKDCDTIAKLMPVSPLPFNKDVTAKVWIEPAVPIFEGKPYVARHYEVSPLTDPLTSTVRVTLYFTQQEFTDYNAALGTGNLLPLNGNDVANNKSNLRILQLSGVTSDGTGLQGSYTSQSSMIDPDDNDIIWNDEHSRWEISFQSSGSNGFFIQTPPATITLNLKLFLEGFYSDINSMRANIYDLGISTDPAETDTITVNLWSAANLSNTEPDYSVLAVLHIDGTASMQYPSTVNGNEYYIAVKHRNHMETWSKLPVMFTSTTAYDFSSAMVQAYDDGVNPPMASVAGGKFAFYGGDVNQDGGIDASDQGDVDNDVSLFAFGYNTTDATGDGSTDASDMQVVDNNLPLFLFYARPY